MPCVACISSMITFVFLVFGLPLIRSSCDYSRTDGIRLLNHVYIVFNPRQEQLCYRTCWYSSKCVSLNWNPRLKICELSDASKEDHPVSVVSASGYTHAEVASTFCQGSYHACADRPCRDSEICVPAVTSKTHICIPLVTLSSTTTTPLYTATTNTPSTTTASKTSTTTTPSNTATTTAPSNTATTTASSNTATTTTPSNTATTTTPSTTTPSNTATTTTTVATTTTSVTTSSSTAVTSASWLNTISYEYKGCYEYSGSNPLFVDMGHDNSLTHDRCATDKCSGYNYFGVSKGMYCRCSHTLSVSGHTKVDDSLCQNNCKGDPESDYCGTAWKLAVFKT